MNKIILICLLILLLTSLVFAEYFIYDNCLVWDSETNYIVYPTIVNLNSQGVYDYFKPKYRPNPYTWLRPDVQIAIYTGTPLKKLRCE